MVIGVTDMLENGVGVSCLSEQYAQGFFHFPYGMNFYLKLFVVETFVVVLGDNNVPKPEFLSFGNTLFYPAHRPHFTAKPYFTGHAPAILNGCVHIA